jgi:hypothetical protein
MTNPNLPRSGSINEPPGSNIYGKEIPEPVLTSLDPASCTIGDSDFTLEVHGEHFFAGSVIFFAGHDEPTTFDEAAGTLSTGVKPSLWSSPVVVQCQIRNGEKLSNALEFTFSEAAHERRTKT